MHHCFFLRCENVSHVFFKVSISIFYFIVFAWWILQGGTVWKEKRVAKEREGYRTYFCWSRFEHHTNCCESVAHRFLFHKVCLSWSRGAHEKHDVPTRTNHWFISFTHRNDEMEWKRRENYVWTWTPCDCICVDCVTVASHVQIWNISKDSMFANVKLHECVTFTENAIYKT